MLDGPRWGPRQGKAEQLVVLCHGVGADGHDLIDLAPWWANALPQAAFVAPDGPEPFDQAPIGRQWFPLIDRTPEQVVAGAEAAAPLLAGFIAAELDRLGLGARDCALMGFSQGAMMALGTGLCMHPAPRAILAFSGALPVTPERLAALADRPPVLLVHGEADEVVPAERSHQAEAALRAAGYRVQSLYPLHLGHGIDDAGLSTGALFLQRVFSDPAEAAARATGGRP
jgi:phospholipase/carboxylesterase